MPFLNWRELEIQASVSPDPRKGSLMTLAIPSASVPALTQALEEVFVRSQGELRVELPSNMTVFCKEREGESRLLLAHPDAQTWVATLALTREHGQAFLARLSSAGPGTQILVGEEGPVARMSNVEVCFQL